jgi:hypothetical protein
MPDRYSNLDSATDSRESRTGPIDSGDSLTNSPIFSGLMVAVAVVVIVLASAM